MERRIYKYTVGETSHGGHVERLVVPKSSEFLSIHSQYGHICVWYIVNPEETETREDVWFQIGTGHQLPEMCVKSNHRGVIVDEKYGLVWNMFCVQDPVENNEEVDIIGLSW